jgi:hypothetical protein
VVVVFRQIGLFLNSRLSNMLDLGWGRDFFIYAI